jgi:hypothetical protein
MFEFRVLTTASHRRHLRLMATEFNCGHRDQIIDNGPPVTTGLPPSSMSYAIVPSRHSRDGRLLSASLRLCRAHPSKSETWDVDP